MRIRIVVGMALVKFAATSAAQDPAQCGFITDSDQQNMCRALAERRVSYCGFIRDRDEQNLCRARVEGKSSYCGFIQDRDKQNMCRALAGSGQ